MSSSARQLDSIIEHVTYLKYLRSAKRLDTHAQWRLLIALLIATDVLALLTAFAAKAAKAGKLSMWLYKLQDVRPGDLVLTRPEADGHTSRAPLYRPVVQTFVTHPDELWHVTLRSDTGV